MRLQRSTCPIPTVEAAEYIFGGGTDAESITVALGS